MKWIVYSLSISLFASAAFVGSSIATVDPAEALPVQELQEQKDDDFIPTEKVPAGSSVSFPVDI